MLSYVRFIPIAVTAVLLFCASPDQSKAQTGEPAPAQASPSPQAPNAQPAGSSTQGNQAATISGTAVDENGDIIPGATVVLQGATPQDRSTTTANDNAAFSFSGLTPGVPYHVVISANGFVDWTSPTVVLTPGDFLFLPGIGLKVLGAETSITVSASSVQIATEQIKLEEQQRVFGFVPNYYVVYDPNPAPLTAKLKFSLAFKSSINPITAAGVLFLAGINQAADTPGYVQGAKGYGQRAGAVAADGLTDIFIGGAILPSLLHQDPRYFYQGTGSHKSRLEHALEAPFVCKGDNGRWQPNYSTIGGDIASSALSTLYYPKSDRNGTVVVENVLTSTAERAVSTIMQEFVLRKLTSGSKNKH